MTDVSNYLITLKEMMFEVFVLISCLSRPCSSLSLNMVGGLLRAVLLLHILVQQSGLKYWNNSNHFLKTFFFSVFCQTDTSGPVFIQEPPNYVDFSNTTGTKIICQARGVPLPNITWTKSNGEPIGTVPGLRQVGSHQMVLEKCWGCPLILTNFIRTCWSIVCCKKISLNIALII